MFTECFSKCEVSTKFLQAMHVKGLPSVYKHEKCLPSVYKHVKCLPNDSQHLKCPPRMYPMSPKIWNSYCMSINITWPEKAFHFRPKMASPPQKKPPCGATGAGHFVHTKKKKEKTLIRVLLFIPDWKRLGWCKNLQFFSRFVFQKL